MENNIIRSHYTVFAVEREICAILFALPTILGIFYALQQRAILFKSEIGKWQPTPNEIPKEKKEPRKHSCTFAAPEP